MASLNMSSGWTQAKVDRLKQLVLRHVANGGSVRDACEQFEFETSGIHKTKLNHLKWVLSIRHTCRDDFKRALELGQAAKLQKYGQQAILDEPVVDEDTVPSMDDDLSDRLFTAVLEVVEDRRQLNASVSEFKANLEQAELDVQELEDARKLAKIQLEKRDKEIQSLKEHIDDLQTSHAQTQSDYDLLRSNTASEYYRLQLQYKEAKMQYDALGAEFRKFQASSRREIEQLENQVREAHTLYEQLTAQYQLAVQDNTRLTKRITDFAQQITAMVPGDSNPRGAANAIPIRPGVINGSPVDEDGSKGSASV